MKKGLAAWAILGGLSFASANTGLQKINVLQTGSQFETAVQQNQVLLKLDKAIVLNKFPDSDRAKRRIEFRLPMQDQQGKLEKELVVWCDLMIATQSAGATLASTEKKTSAWKVKDIQKLDRSMERWILAKDGAPDLSLTCASLERKGDQAVKVTLVPALVNRAVSQVSASLLTTADVTHVSPEAVKVNQAKPASRP